MKPFRVEVRYESSDEMKALQAQLQAARDEIEQWKVKYKKLENKVMEEQYINIELTDILRQYKIPFRQIADTRNRRKQ